MSENFKNEKRRLKVLYLYKILREQTDENNSITMPQIISQLSAYGISAGRKALYDDIKSIKYYYADVVLAEAGRIPGYSLVDGDEVKIVSPENLRKNYSNMLKTVLKANENDGDKEE